MSTTRGSDPPCSVRSPLDRAPDSPGRAPRRWLFGSSVLVAAVLLAPGCADGSSGGSGSIVSTDVVGSSSSTSSSGSSSTSSSGSAAVSLPDRERERTEIRLSLGAVLHACGDRDRDRLRDEVHDRVRERVDGALFRFREEARFELGSMSVVFDGDRATVRARVRIRVADRPTPDESVSWRFEYDGDGWRLVDLPPCLDDSPTARDDPG
ncbi:MAG: hypothetical protein ACO23O_12520 [Ilumatobacteraceae bacterium]